MDNIVLDYKLAWVDSQNNAILHSKMFETLEQAIAESINHQNFFVFKLISKQDGDYNWDVLPYGNYTLLQIGLTSKDFFEKYWKWMFLGLGTFIAFKMAFSPKMQ